MTNGNGKKSSRRNEMLRSVMLVNEHKLIGKTEKQETILTKNLASES